MKCLKLAMVILLLTLLNSCSIHGGAPLPPEWQAILDAYPKNPVPRTSYVFPDYVPEYEPHVPDSAKSDSGNQIKILRDSHGDYTGRMVFDSRTGIWTINNKSGDYVGRIDKNGIITNQKGDYMGRID